MADKAIRIGVAGALGRMGQAVAAAVESRAGVEIGALFDRPGTEGQILEGLQRGRVLVSPQAALETCEVIVDFTTPEATALLARRAAERGGLALVVASTGLSQAQETEVAKAAASLPIVKSGNFSLGVNVLMGLVEETARRLEAGGWDIEVLEAHHRRKVDAPSGTALMLGQAAARGRGIDLSEHSERGRDGITGARKEGAIGFSVLRGGGIVGEHSVVFAAEDEILTLSHSARDRSLFARGAVEAALWAAGRKAGLYDMMDVLGFRG